MLTDFEKNVLGAVEAQPAPQPQPQPQKKSLFKRALDANSRMVENVGNFAIGTVKGAADTVMSVPRNIEKATKEYVKLDIEKTNNKIREQITQQNDELLKVYKSLPAGDPKKEKYKRLIQQNLDQFNALGKSEMETIAQVDDDSSYIPFDKNGNMKDAVNQALVPKNNAQKYGFMTEKIGELIVPAAAVSKADKALKGMKILNETSKGAKLFNATTRIGARSLLDAGVAGAATLGQGAYQGRFDTKEGREGIIDEAKRNAAFAGTLKGVFATGGELFRTGKFFTPKAGKLDGKLHHEMTQAIDDTGRTVKHYDQFIADGSMPASDIYKNGTKVLTAEAQENIARDISLKMQSKIGGRLGQLKSEQFLAAIKGMDTTGDDLNRIAKEVLDNTDVVRARNIAGEIFQGPKEVQDIARRVVPKLDISKVRTYDDFMDVFREKISKNSTIVDDALSKNKKPMPLDSLARTTKVGEKSVVSRPVNDALEHLEEYYVGSKDVVNAERIRQLREVGSLTAKEVNDVAREYSREFSTKAFSKLGEPLTSVNARAMENTRKGVKEIARSIVGDDSIQAIDRETSELYKLMPLVDKISKTANAQQQKMIERGLLEKLGDKAGKVVDHLTGGSVRSFVTSFFPRGQGIKLANPVELEKKLAKNLDELLQLQNLIDNGAPENKIIEFLNKMVAPAKKSLNDGTLGFGARRVLPEAKKYSDQADFEAQQ